MRDADLLARYGGEEFVALMPDTDQTQATDAVEKLRRAVMGTRFHFNDLDVQITISCGVAEFSDDSHQHHALICVEFLRPTLALHHRPGGRSRR